ncbi:Mobile element protein [Frigoribacterium sp. JB110]|nr:Mobile element protein [Frigoribacterium sp. JB110]
MASELMGTSSRAMPVAGEHDSQVLAGMAKGALRKKIPQLEAALHGRFTEHHAFLVGEYLTQIDTPIAFIDRLTVRIEDTMEWFRAARDALTTIPGVSTIVEDVIIAETGGDMTVFDARSDWRRGPASAPVRTSPPVG